MSEISWQTESLRVTAFYRVQDTPGDVNRLWGMVRHRQPDQVSSRPNEGIQVAQGRFGTSDRQLQCAIRPDRVDWVLRAAPPAPNTPPEGLLTIDTFAGVLPSFRDLGAEWLERSPAVTRLAFGAVLMFEVSNPFEANESLFALLPSVNFGSEDVSDFVLRINRRRSLSSVEGGLANRLSTWSVVQGGSVGVAVSGDGPPQLFQQSGHFACRLELDINTVSTFAVPLGGGEAVKVFRELVDLGREIAEQGDES